MNVVVDTSSWISYLRGDPEEKLDVALQEGRVFLPPIVVAELLSGVQSARHREKLIDLLQELPLCEADFDHWVRVGQLRHTLARKALSISTPDAHVAQCTLDLEGYLLTDDRVFNRIGRLTSLKTL